MPRSPVSRRNLLSAGAIASTAVVLPGDRPKARSYVGEVPWAPGAANAPEVFSPGAFQFLTESEVRFLDAAISRLIPSDELGPGAKEAGVTVFLDRQLAGSYGRAQTWYMQGPWREGEETQGYQSRLTPAQLYRVAIKAIDDHCHAAFDGKAFYQLGTDLQDRVLAVLESNDASGGPNSVKIDGVRADIFFAQLLENTIEGFFADPIYGGNRNMVGWRLIGFPGARYDYRRFISKHGQKLDLPPVGIQGRPGWNPDS